MNKTELIEAIAEKLGSAQSKEQKKEQRKEAAEFLNAFIEVTEETLKEGDSIVIPGFGSFIVADRAARMARDFKTGKHVQVAASKCVRFKVGKTLKDIVKK